MEALFLAVELHAEIVLMDEKAGRFGLGPMGTLGILGAAKDRGLIPACEPVLRQIQQEAGAWFGEALVARFLAQTGEA